jgi:DNA-binding MarR family transcriptional regulator
MVESGRPPPPPADSASNWTPRRGVWTSLLFDAFVLGQRSRTLVGAAMAGSPLRPDEYAAYSVVFELRTVTMSELARRLGMPVTTAADYVRAMRARGHVERLPHPTDRRARLLSLTPAGLQAHRAASHAFDAAADALSLELLPGTEDAARAMLQELADAAGRALGRLEAPKPG